MLGGAIVPYIYGLIFLDEPITLARVVALLMIVAAVVINSALGLKPNNGTPSYTAPAPSVSVQVNSGNIAAGHGIRGKVSVGQEPLRFQQKANIRTMSLPNASIELNLPIASKEHFRMQVGGSVKIEKNKKPEYRVGSEIKAEF